MQVTVCLLIMGGGSANIDLVVHAVKSQHRQVKVVKFPADVADPQSPKSLQSVLLENMQSFSRSAQHMLFLLPW